MNTNSHSHFTVPAKGTTIATPILDICCRFEFPEAYFPVFFCIHLCTPEHFREPGIPESELERLFDAIDLSSTESAISSIASWQDGPLKAAFLNTCDPAVSHLVQMQLAGRKVNIDTFIQIYNMQLLYLNKDFQEQMLTLYTFFIKPYLAA